MRTTDCGKPKRILVLAGSARSLTNFRGPLIRALCKAGFEVHAAAPDLSSNQVSLAKLHFMNVICHDVNMSRAGLNPTRDILTIVGVYRLAKKVKPNFILSYTIKPVIYGLLASWLAGVPHRYALITGLGYAFTGAATGKRAVVSGIARGLYRISLGRASKVFFQNPDDESLFRQLHVLPESTPSAVVNGSGIDLNEFKPALLPDGPVQFLLIARLLADKGVREYMAAARLISDSYPDVKFHLVGDVDDNPNSISKSELADWLALGTVNYWGRLNDVRPAIEAASVYVLPSYREGTPRTTLEAMAMGRPVITTDAPGCRETVEDGYNGFLVPVKSISDLERAMIKFIRNPDLIVEMGMNSLELVARKYDVDLVNKQMLSGMGLVE